MKNNFSFFSIFSLKNLLNKFRIPFHDLVVLKSPESPTNKRFLNSYLLKFFYFFFSFARSIEKFNERIESYINFHERKDSDYDFDGNESMISEDLMQFESKVC